MNSSITERIVTRIAEASGTEETDLPPLYDTIDPDQLDALVQSLEDGRVSFTYAGYEVTVDSETEITIANPTLAKHP